MLVDIQFLVQCAKLPLNKIYIFRKQLPFEKLTEQEKRERRKKFIEQRMTKKNVKLLTLPYDVVTESDVMDILSDFSLDFLIKVKRNPLSWF